MSTSKERFEARECIASTIEYAQVSFDEPPEPKNEHSYNAEQLVARIDALLARK